jgi:4-hydroxy-L-threonine phosphate dehydrogenase PdxA
MSALRVLVDDLIGALDATAPFAATARRLLPVALEAPAHGTAFDTAGRGVAAASSRVEAIENAAMLAAGRAA